ncbi:hypothetical protein NM208_g71 [Fusarium decemcellulare]|uniref:Uncharacterized protein n=2 Tax=Fusarium decemcellulare TaxID=57161 RepID=A0ACC1T105_9HYPO|nr:hypothetical protein NM208_g628 [Fusarium decemcellulare]KAJ3550258.1 hypothetical protein NM208_g71 [Fusarium decemcellulare]
MNTPFDPVRCAELHNQLLAKATSRISDSAKHTQRDVLTRWHQLNPETRPTNITENESLCMFLSLIDSYKPNDIPLTAEFTQPEPWWFDNGLHDTDDRNIILLYGDETQTPTMDGGLYFNLDTDLVHWGRLRGGRLPPDEQWVPLELALQKALDMWECGKFDWGYSTGWLRSSDVVSYRPWTPEDLNSTLRHWDRLIEAIQSRLPLSGQVPETRLLEPLSTDVVEQFTISSFAKAFLCAAKRPSFKYIAPGITTFTPESFASIYGAESPTSRRSNTGQGEGSDVISLILPSATGHIVKGEGQYLFDGEDHLHLADASLYEHAGLYIALMYPMGDGDATDLITDKGAINPIRFDGRRPWGPWCGIRLEEMFSLWVDLVEQGSWEVGPEGIATPHSWFTEPETIESRRLLWTDGCR